MIKKVISVSLTIIVIVGVIVILLKDQSLLTSLKTISIFPLVMVFFFQLMSIVLNIIINRLIFLPVVKVKWNDCGQSTVMSTILNCFLPMKLGSTYQAVYLKKKYNLPFSWFTGTFIVTFLLTILLACIWGLIAIVDIFITKKMFSWLFLGLYLSIASAIFLLLFLNKFFLKYLRKINIKFKFWNRLKLVVEQIADGIESLKKDRKVLFILLLLSFLYVVNCFLIAFFEFRSIGLNTSMGSVALFSSLSLISILVNITPGALGVREFLQYVFSSIIRINGDQIILISIIDRSILLVALGILFLILINFRSFRKVDSI